MLFSNCLAFFSAPNNPNEKNVHFHNLYYGTPVVCQFLLTEFYKCKWCYTAWQPESQQMLACLLLTFCLAWTEVAYSSVSSTKFSVWNFPWGHSTLLHDATWLLFWPLQKQIPCSSGTLLGTSHHLVNHLPRISGRMQILQNSWSFGKTLFECSRSG